MTETIPRPSRPFFDVFISYRHRDAGRIAGLKEKVRSHRFEAFQDTDFAEFRDTQDVPREKVEALRTILSQATCLIFAYSREEPQEACDAESPVGSWMPWELGFFDGSISSRIGIYLLDGKPEGFTPEAYFRHSEYLQVYETLTDENLKAFLDRNAVRERRIDNVRSGFIWLEHLRDECLSNPANVGLGVTEWFAEHMARSWRACGNEPAAQIFDAFRRQLDDLRVTVAPSFRWSLADDWISTVHDQWRAALRGWAGSAAPRADEPRAAPRAPAGPGARDLERWLRQQEPMATDVPRTPAPFWNP